MTLEARLDKNAVRDVYTNIAPIYDVWALFTEARARRRALELARVRDGESLLEIAVGTGLAFGDLVKANPNGRSVGIDLTPAMLARARARIRSFADPPRVELAIGDAYALPFEDASFDLVHNAYMFDLLPEADFGIVLGEMARVLKPGGRLVLVNMAHGERWYQRIPEWIYRVRPRWMGGCRGVALAPEVARAGFGDVKRETIVQGGFPSEVVFAIRRSTPAAK